MNWQLQEAKQRFSELVRRALDEGPQVVTRRGEQAVVVIAARDYARLTGGAPDFKAFLLSGPAFSQLEIERDAGDRSRAVDL
jgi:prevent-host-death family protein